MLKDVKVTNSAGDGVDIGDHDFITLSGVTVEGMPGFSHAVDINFAGAANDIRIEGSTFNFAAGQIGLKIADAAAVTNLQVVNSTYNGGQYGFYFANDTAGSGDTVTGTFSGLDFNGQSNVGGDGFRGFGIYAEKLSNATLTDIDVAAPASSSNLGIRGIHLNLKNGSFENISLSDVDLTGFDAVQSLSIYNPLLVVAVKPGASLDGVTLNDITGVKNAASTGNGGIVVDVFHEVYPAQIADLTITNSTPTGVLKVQTSDYTSITGNTITGDLQFVLVDQPASPGNSLAGNTVSGAVSFSDGRDAVLPDGADNLTLFNGTLIGAPNNNQSGTGNADANVITGNDGANVLVGGGGNDSIAGGAVTDTAVYSDAATVTWNAGTEKWVVTSAANGTDTLTDIEAVDLSGAGGARILLVDKSATGGYATIQEAVDAANAGDTIMVAAGNYAETVTISTANLKILGANASVMAHDGGDLNAGRGTESIVTGKFVLNADGATISGFEITGSTDAIRVNTGGQALDNITISNNYIHDTTDSPIRAGLGFGGGIGSDDWSITGNLIDSIVGNARTGMVLFNIDGLTVTNNVINHDVAASTGRRGINLDGVLNATVSNNTVNLGLVAPTDATAAAAAAPWAIQISMSDRAVENVNVSGNTISGASSGVSGLSQRGMTNVDITGNTVSNVITGVVLNAGSAPPLAAGVTMDVDVTGNSISATTNAIFVRDLHDGHPNGPVTFVGLDVTGNTVTQGVVQIGRAETFVPSGASGAGNGLLNVTGTTNINGSGTADIVQVEGSGAVNFTGGEGADSFNGSSGNDSINGGGGNDTFISSGARAAYTAAWNAATSTVTLTDNRVGMDGTDTITNVESFVFADSTLSLAALLANASNRAPVVAAQNVTVGFGQSVLASSMISSASDPDAGDFITKYAFKDLGSGGGYFQVNGVTQTAGQWFEVATANLSTVRYFAGSASGSETIQIGVNDGDMWSPTVASVATSIGNRAPVVTAQNVTVSLGQSVLASSMIASSSDPDAAFGDAITKYAFKDLGSGGGYFQVNGVTQTAGQWFEVATANLSTVRYFGSSTAGTETIQIGAHDGDAWSPTVASVATSVGNRAPVVTAQNVSVQIGQSVLASTMIA